MFRHPPSCMGTKALFPIATSFGLSYLAPKRQSSGWSSGAADPQCTWNQTRSFSSTPMCLGGGAPARRLKAAKESNSSSSSSKRWQSGGSKGSKRSPSKQSSTRKKGGRQTIVLEGRPTKGEVEEEESVINLSSLLSRSSPEMPPMASSSSALSPSASPALATDSKGRVAHHQEHQEQQPLPQEAEHEAMKLLEHNIDIHRFEQEAKEGKGTAPDLAQVMVSEFRNNFKATFPQHFRLRLAVAEELAGANIVIPTGFKDQIPILPAIAMRAECHDRRFSETHRIAPKGKRVAKAKKGDKQLAEVCTLSWIYVPGDTKKPLLRRIYSGRKMEKVRKTAVADFQRAVPDVALFQG